MDQGLKMGIMDEGGLFMKIARIGAAGHVGLRLLAELLRRRHEVTGIARYSRQRFTAGH
jgi:putative NADH-flavin reductase